MAGGEFRFGTDSIYIRRQVSKVQTDWDAWCHRSLAEEDVVRLVLHGTVVRVRLDRQATPISLLVVLGIRRDGQKVLLSVRNIGGESEAAWRSLLDDLVLRGLPTPGYVIINGAAGLEKAFGMVLTILLLPNRPYWRPTAALRAAASARQRILTND